jgi:hypothetical protein
VLSAPGVVLASAFDSGLDSGLRPGVATAPAAGATPALDADESEMTKGAAAAESRGAAVAESSRFSSTTVAPAPRTTTPAAIAIAR